jgi:hypothetical protein
VDVKGDITDLTVSGSSILAWKDNVLIY